MYIILSSFEKQIAEAKDENVTMKLIEEYNVKTKSKLQA
jgi:hypothetical protein